MATGCRLMWDSTLGKPLWIYFRVGDLAMLGGRVSLLFTSLVSAY